MDTKDYEYEFVLKQRVLLLQKYIQEGQNKIC